MSADKEKLLTCTIGKDRGQAFQNSLSYATGANHIEETSLLASKAGIGQILGRRATSDSHAAHPVLAHDGIRSIDLFLYLGRKPGIHNHLTGLPPTVGEVIEVGDINIFQQKLKTFAELKSVEDGIVYFK